MSVIKAVIRSIYAKDFNAGQNEPVRSQSSIKAALDRVGKFFSEHNGFAWVLKILLAAAIGTTVWGLIYCYNNYARLDTRSEAYFAQVGVELKRRDNLIPNLVMTAKRYSTHEGAVFRHVSDAREMLTRAGSVKDKIKAANELDMALSRLLAIFEQYPDLKAIQSIQDLIKELSNTENRIADEKSKYNDVVREFNQLRHTFPTNILGSIFGFNEDLPYIGTSEDLLKTPNVLLEWEGNLPGEDDLAIPKVQLKSKEQLKLKENLTGEDGVETPKVQSKSKEDLTDEDG